MGVAGAARLARAPSSRSAANLFLLLAIGFMMMVPISLAQQFQVIFNPAQSTYFLLEEQPVGTAVVVLDAYYLVFPSFQIRVDGVFALDASQPDSQYFTIDSAPRADNSATLGTLRTAAVLDRDAAGAQTTFTLVVSYSIPDGSLSSQHMISILLEDVNDNPPQFSQSVYSVAILERAADGSTVAQLSATDIDQVLTEQVIDDTGENFEDLTYVIDHGRFFYSIVGGNEEGKFQISTEGGTISVSPEATFDVAVQDGYNITVAATDAPGLNSTALVVVDILDSNDHQPQILAPRGLNLTLSEYTPTGLIILDAINATDEDYGLNAEIEFLIISGDDTGSFSIDPSTGEIALTASLDREGGTGEIVNLTVAARDQGIPPLQDTINVVIFIEDVNDFPPVFQQEFFEESVSEGVRIGLSVLQVLAFDGDEGPGGVVMYDIIRGAEGKFRIDPQTGEIFTNGTLDREEKSLYQLVIEAVDNPLNTSFQLSSVINVTIAINDLNDNPPIFNQTYYEIHILDDLRPGADVIQISASDSDEGVNAEITYQFVEPLPSNSERFRIRDDSGLVRVNNRPRIDIQTVYFYVIRALDGGSPTLQADVNLTIYIHDVDETPPTFEQEAYNETLNETVDVGSFVLQVAAFDPDPGAIGEVQYRIPTIFDEAGSFSVNDTFGDIYVASRLDFDARNFIFFQVEAYDGGFPEPFTDLTNVTIFLRGENDEPPSIIFPEGYSPTVPENEPPGYEIVYLSNFTTDPDMGLGGEFNFSLFEIYDPFSEGANDSFSLNTVTGLLTSLRVFDREAQPEGVVVAIETRDFGTPPQSRVTNITVVIGDKNDEVPYFPSNLSITAYEFLPPGVQILEEYRAIDDDIGINAELQYDIVEGNLRSHFSIDPQTGGLFAAATLNKTDQKFYNLTIIARNTANQQFFTFGLIEIEIIDANDEAPVFSSDVYAANVSENVPPATVFFQVNATDADVGTNAQIQYFFDGASNASLAMSERFTIDPTSGEIATNAVFDREYETSFTLHVIAVDNGSVPMTLTGSTTVLVAIDDRNDLVPTLHNTSYSAEVIENTPNDTFVLSVSASDEDAEFPNNAFFFSLSGSRSDVFQIDPTSGDITVTAEVDWEEGEVINIVVIATDLGEPPLSSTAYITIYIEDVNDRAPIFTPGSLSLGIFENIDPPAPVGSVVALDPDSAGNSSLVSYEVLMDLTGGKFNLNTESGEVTFVRGSLNRESQPFYEFVVRALDHGDPQQSTNASLIINVLDSNDFAPEFEQELFTTSISENTPLGTTILTLVATDMDVGTNAELSFSILDSSLFAVNETSGEVTTISESYDYESEIVYSFVVMVTDHGNPPLSHTSQVTVTITDFNDNAPHFINPPYSAVMEENLSPYTTVLQVASTDHDSGENQVIHYSLADGGGSEYFGIDPETGVLHTVRYIDREVTPRFDLTVVANNSLSAHPRWSEALATVEISDFNDMHPSFDIVTNVYVPEDSSVGSVVFSLNATDGDEGLGGVVHYSDIHGNEAGVFVLDPDTGDVMLSSTLDFEVHSLYEFVVSATDSGTPNLTNYTNVLVHVEDVNDNPPYFINTEYTVTVNSNTGSGTAILEMMAVDPDQGTNAELLYAITDGNDLALFQLQSESQPSLLTSGSLETGQSIVVVVEVRNPASGGATMTGLANVTIHVQAGLSSLPRFTHTSFMSSVAEDQTSATLFELSADTFNEVDFTLESGNEQSMFSVNSAGTVALVAGSSLDHDTVPSYQLTLSATSTGGDEAYCTLTVNVRDVNDNSPEFISPSFLVHIPETTPIGAPIFAAMATDADGSAPANEIEYAISSSESEITSTFAVDPLTGEISLRRSLDFEGGDHNFTFVISATNAGATPIRSSEATVSIEVVNGNNHRPDFTSQILEPVVLYENQTVGLNIFNATAEDGDEGSAGEVTFALKGNHRYFDFSIDSFTGEVRVNGELDRDCENQYQLECETQYQLEIVAADRGNPGLTATILLLVAIQDVNDNTPIWNQPEYFVSLLENTSVGVSVIQVEATDIDQVDSTEIDGNLIYHLRNGLVEYNITEGDPGGRFFIDPASGVVMIAAPLDRESASHHSLTLTATDGGGRASNATLLVTVLDTNDVKPTFSHDVYSVGIPENSPNGTFLLTVVADDIDLLNGAVFFYEIESGNIDEAFAMNASTGDIWLDMPVLDRELINLYNLTVAATDLGDPPLTGSTQILIQVLDLNEFPPVFDLDAYTGSIPENATALTPVLNLNTSDLDFGENATAAYYIVAGNNQSRFGITVSTGEIFVAIPLDYELVTEYELVVMATDSGPISTQLSSEVNVTIFIQDVNDNRPRFHKESYSATVHEDAPPFSPLIYLQATDDDSGANAEFSFSLDLQGGSEYFVVDPETGILSLSADASLDYEYQNVYQVVAIVTDFGDPQLNSTVPVTIEIADVNDNTPLFNAPSFTASVAENLAAGVEVATVSATDADSGENAQITFSIARLVDTEEDCIATCSVSDVCASFSSPPSPSLSSSQPPFAISNFTGLVTTSLPLDRENTSSYLLAIEASDSGNETRLSSLTCLLVTVLDENDEYPTFPLVEYSTNISEHAGEGVRVVQVAAQDGDISSNAEISYRLLTESGSFAITPVTGELLTLGGYDREERDGYDVIVLATDGGDSPLNSTVVVRVIILDENDNPPMFGQPEYTVSFAENQPPYSSVVFLLATDADIGTNADLSYAISSAVPQNHFQINATSGLLQTTSELDREQITSYLVTIFSMDMGNPRLNSSTLLNITVLDTNDNAPTFTEEEYSVLVEEELIPDAPILYLSASDDDVGTNSLIRFSLNETSPAPNSFAIDPVSGALSVVSPLDAEHSLSYSITVIASNDGAAPEQASATTVTVAVGDVNDHSPLFSQPDYVVSVNESAEVGSEVIQLVVSDGDATLANSELTFEISGGQNLSLFSINPHTGAMFVSAPLDREQEPTHTLQVTVRDNGTVPGQLETTVSVTFVLYDANDNTPIFEQSRYLFSVQENEPSGILIGRVRANDIDLQSVTYSIAEGLGSGSGSGLGSGETSTLGAMQAGEFFEISPQSGDIYSKISFDREERAVYTFYVVAMDTGAAVQRSSEVKVSVAILDRNDVAPSFSLPNYTVAWPEDTAVGSTVLTVVATDSDLEAGGRVEYSLSPNNDSLYFSVNGTNGDVTLEQMFDREGQDLFMFEVIAQDLGTPSLTSSVVVVVAVLDVNDNEPILNATEYSAVLNENTPLNSKLITIAATDADIGSNSEVQFSLTEDFDGTFSIHDRSGIISLTASLDYEYIQNYTFSVVAMDTGEYPISSSAGVFIEVTDLNDNPPIFESSVFQTSIPENAILGAPVFQIPASDADSTSNGELRYSILGGNLAAAFEVDEASGLLSLSDYIDREITDSYILSLRAVDLGSPQFTAEAELHVEVVDVNDHVPRFDSTAYFVSVPESSGMGAPVVTVEATDGDVGVNANLTYSIIAGDPEGKFKIDPQTRDVTVREGLDFETIPAYSLTILVSDQGLPEAQTDTAILSVSILDVNEHPPSYPQPSYLLSLPDNTPPGSRVGAFAASDDDLYMHPSLSYSLADSGNASLFSIDEHSGYLYTTSLIPPGQLSISLTASDGTYAATIDVTVAVSRLSLPLPAFQPPSFLFSVPEDTALGGRVGLLEVEFSDDVIFSLFANPSVDFPFEVTSGGEIDLIGQLDYETTPTYIFSVQATSISNASLVSHTLVTIVINDVNDNPPTFESDDYILTLSELTPINTLLLPLSAYDLDSLGVNSEFEISIVEGNEGSLFDLDPNTSELTVARVLDYEDERVIVLTVNVSNQLASPVLWSTAEVRVELWDENDHSPQFSEPYYQTEVPASAGEGTPVLTLFASDVDSGSNAELIFSLTHLDVPLSFTVNHSSGVVSTGSAFSGVEQSYVIAAAVSDRGAPQPRSDTTTIFITVVPDNNYAPQFSEPGGYSVVVPETLPMGGFVMQIFASDSDSTDSQLTFSIASGDPDEIFTIDPSTGILILSGSLDYQEQSLHQLEVTAEDDGTPSRISPVAVNISVQDVNNHAPLFEEPAYQVSIFENTTVASPVLQVSASDEDATELTYLLTVNAYQSGSPLFSLDSATGLLSTAAPLDREFSETYQLLVSAVDSGYPIRLSNSVPVIITLIDLNDTPPQFDQSEYTFSLLRYLAPGLYVAMVTATDGDLIGQQLEYSITEDTSNGIFGVNVSTGVISTILRVPEDALAEYRLQVTASDGVFTTPVTIKLDLTSEGDFCEGSGLCTSVQPVNCSFIQFGSCDPRILGNLYDPFCDDNNYMLSPDQYLCIQHYCDDPALLPCPPASACLPPSLACAGLCPQQETALCPTTQTCHPTSLRESCDGSNVTCLIGQTLVEQVDGTRECHPTSSLPPAAQGCAEEQPYCIAIDECANLSSLTPCPTCPRDQVLCTDTRECVVNPLRCCGENGFFCEILDQCLGNGDTCKPPNIPPSVFAPLIHLGSIVDFDPDASESGDGHVIRAFLSNDSGNNPAIDSQGEEVSVAVIEIPKIPQWLGEWQYSVCIGLPGSTEEDSCEVAEWVAVEGVSEDNALLLPSSARIRFARRTVEVEGAVWLRVKLWDGNEDGYLSSAVDLVRYSQPRHADTTPFSATGAFSENSTLLSLLLFPTLPLPTVSPHSTLTLSPIPEDTPITGNPGNTIEEVVIQVLVPDLPALPEEEILGFPDAPSFVGNYGNLFPAETREGFFTRVAEVNPTRLERQSVREQGLVPGVGIRLGSQDDGEAKGRWQVSWNGDVRQFVYVDSLLSSTNQILLLNATARIRFIPIPDYCGQVSIPFQPWDGYWNESGTSRSENVFLITMETTLSPYNLNEVLEASQTIECVPDKPLFLVNRLQLDPIPYYISYDYERLITLNVSVETSVLRGERERLSELLHVAMDTGVSIVRIAPAIGGLSSQVSFSVEGEALGLSEVRALLGEKADVLEALGFPVSDVSQAAYYGPGEGCSPSLSPLPVPGVSVASLTNQIADDRDGETLGVAITSADSAGDEGVWQYRRGNWSDLLHKIYSNQTNFETAPQLGPWINFPPGLSDSRALLLHSTDRLRFVPTPSFFWANQPPSISLKTWDMSEGLPLLSTANEALLSAINTDPYTDTTQSLFHTVGLFSDNTAVVEASRRGCDDVINSGLTFDSCCVCGGTGENCAGCDGVGGSGKLYGFCDECGSDGGCEGCDLVPFSNSGTGNCEECVSVYSVSGDLVGVVKEEVGGGVEDCEGVCFGRGVSDECGVCSGGESSHQYNSDMDCAAVCFGDATVDDCGYCTGPGTMLTHNWNLDCTGVCGGPFRSDSCSICQLPDGEGGITEHRDCLGVCFGSAILDECEECYGESSADLVGSSVDVCGICGGQNATCDGCDGSPASGAVVDSCDVCGGNDCGCFKIDYIEPQWGPKSGGTEVLVHGAGFFLNDSALVSFDFDPQAENCGAPREKFGGESISASCQFASGQNNAITADDVTILHQSTIRCITKATTTDLLFDLSVSIETGPHSNAVLFRYYDNSRVSISEISPVDVEIDHEISVSFHGDNFIDTGASVCLLYDIESCGMDAAEGEVPVVIPANYISEKEIMCTLPAATLPCEIRVQLSLDGQPSGVVTPGDLTFTYLYSAPLVPAVYFSDDLSDLIIQFDRPVELASSPDSAPACSAVFSPDTLALLGGPSDAACYWANSRQEALVTSLLPSAEATVDSQVSFRAGAITTRGQVYSYAITDLESFSVDSSLSSITPVAIIDGLHSIPPCGYAEFTGIHSLNPGFRGMTYRWSVLTADSTIPQYTTIIEYLDSLEPDADSISLDASWFVAGTDYFLELVAVNSIGLESLPERVNLVKDEGEARPQLYVRGQEVREIGAGEGVTLEGSVFIPDCASEHYSFEFLWQLYQITDERRATLSSIDLSSLPTLSPVLYLPSTLLTTSASTYVATLTVSETSIPYSESASVTIRVAATSLQARVHGGDRSLSQNRMLVLDARASVYDAGLPSLSFTWSCNVIGSGEPCYNQSQATPTPLVIPAADIVSIPGYNIELGLEYNFTVTVSQTDSIQSHASIAVSVTSATPPIVEVTVGGGEGVTSREVVMRGLVYSVTPVTSVQWESVRIEGHGYLDLSDPTATLSQTAYPPSSITAGRVSPANLVLSPDSLTPRLTYTFQLTATNEEGSVFARVSVTPDPAPHSATLHVLPASGGTSLETVFTLSVSSALDSDRDSPFLYQFGVLREDEMSGDREGQDDIVWLSGAQVESSIETLLPSGPSPNRTLTVLARVFDRSGGYSDTTSYLTVHPAPSISDEFIRELLTSLETEFTTSKNWQNLLHDLISIAVELDSSPSLSPSHKRDSLSLFLNIFSDHLPATQTHYQLSARLLSLLTANSGADGDTDTVEAIAAALTAIGEWFQRASAVGVVPTEPVTSDQDEPLQLLPVEEVSSPENQLSPTTATHLLAAWSNIVSYADTPTAVAASFTEAIELSGSSLCQGMVYGEPLLLVTSSAVDVSTHKSQPSSLFNVSGNLVEFGAALDEAFFGQACADDKRACFETCLQGARYSFDLFRNAGFLQLTTIAQDMVTAEIEGANPQAVELLSSILSVTVSIPSQNGFLVVEGLEQDFRILLRLHGSVSSDGSTPLCLYREVGGTSGASSSQWQLDTTTPPAQVEIDSVTYSECRFNHLTEFAIGLLPPPIIPSPSPSPSPTPTPPPLPTSTPAPASSSALPVETPVGRKSQPGLSPAVAAVPILLVIIIVAIVSTVVILFLVWKKKKRTKISPDEGQEGTSGVATDGKTKTKLLKFGTLTPEESKVPMPIIELLASGERKVVGSMNVLPSIRLRELRYHIMDHFASFKSKPFYFLTRQLVDIETPTEQQQFVSLVYGQEADKPIFVRRVETASDLSRLHFCTCGNAAQFECTSCSAQGYCSPECQSQDWTERHQRECGRLGEKKHRMSVLRRQSTTLSPIDEYPRFLSPVPASPEKQATSAATPVDFRSLLSSQRSYQRPSFSSPPSLEPSLATPSFSSPPTKPSLPPLSTPRTAKTTLSMLASQPRPPTIQEEDEGEVEGAKKTSISYHHTPAGLANRPPISRQVARSRLPPLSTTSPARPLLTSPFPRGHLTATPSLAHPHYPPSTFSPPHSTPISSHHSPTSKFFQRTNPPLMPSREEEVSPETRKLSIQSVGSLEFGNSLSLQQPPNIRKDPHLESDTSSESGNEEPRSDGRPASTTITARPPSLSVRSKKSAASKKTASAKSSSSDSSSSSSGSDSEDSTSSQSHPASPLVTKQD